MIPDSENPLDGDRYMWPLDFGDRVATLNGVETCLLYTSPSPRD